MEKLIKKQFRLTRIGDFYGKDHPIEVGKDFLGYLDHDLTTDVNCIINDAQTGDWLIKTTTICNIKVIGNVTLFCTDNSMYLLQPL